MQISTAFECERATSFSHAFPPPLDRKISHLHTTQKDMQLSTPSIPSHHTPVLPNGEQLWTAHVNCMKCHHVLHSTCSSGFWSCWSTPLATTHATVSRVIKEWWPENQIVTRATAIDFRGLWVISCLPNNCYFTTLLNYIHTSPKINKIKTNRT